MEVSRVSNERICIVTTSYPRSERDDAGIFIKRLVLALSRLGARGAVVVPFDQNEPLSESHEGFEIVRFRYGVFARGSLAFGAGIIPNLKLAPLRALQIPLLMIGFVVKILLQRELRAIYAQWLVSAIPALIAGQIKGVPVIVSARGEDLRLLRRALPRAVILPFLKRARGIIAVSESAALELQRLTGIEATVIPNGVEHIDPSEAELMAAKELIGFNPNERYLLFVGSVIRRKKIELLIELLAKLPESSYHLLIVGRLADEVYLSYLRGLASTLGVKDRLRFVGVCAPELISALHKITGIYLTASEFEGRPNAVLEALAAGSIVFASDIPSHREIIVEGENGFIFREIDEAVRLIVSVDDRQKIGAAAQRSVQSRSWSKAAKSYLDLLEQ